MSDTEISLFIAGDAIITVPWSDCDEPAFRTLVDEMRACDLTLMNLETVIRSDKGYPQADSGGTWTSSPPEIASELAWAGVNMVSHANNHAFDYGTGGILETLHHVEQAGIVLSGSGPDLQAARAPRHVQAKGAMVGHVSLAASFVPYGRASHSRPDVAGRPGINPLRIDKDTVFVVPDYVVGLLKRFDAMCGKSTHRYVEKRFTKAHLTLEAGDRFGVLKRGRLRESDRAGNLEAIRTCSDAADLTIVSIHSHDQRKWLRRFILETIEAGADIVLVHGVHHVRGVEIVSGKPVFHGLGDFVYQTGRISAFPSDAYEKLGMDAGSSPEDFIKESRRRSRLWRRSTYEGCAARIDWKNGALAGLQLLPVDLGFDGPDTRLGRPHRADPHLSRRIIERIAAASRKLGTRVRFVESESAGRVEL